MKTLILVIAVLAFRASLAGAQSKSFYTGSYPADHWALHFSVTDDDVFVARIRQGSHRFAVILHPLDSRGYRTLVSLTTPDMKTTLNREFTLAERFALLQVMAVVAQAYESLGLISQTVVAGNNAHAFAAETCAIQLGSPEEPQILHGHVFGRGNPGHEYIAGIPLGGPAPGAIYDLRATTTDVPGNEHMVAWQPERLAAVAKIIGARIEEVFRREPWLRQTGLRLEEIKRSDSFL